MKRDITQAIQNGLSYISSQQNDDGGFTSYLSTDLKISDTSLPVRTVFIPSVILTALARIPESKNTALRERLAAFLLSQRSRDWSFNYWASDEPLKTTRNYPNDLDDTFCALAGLYYADKSIVTPEVLASAVKLLITTEVSAGGPYRTWLVGQDNPIEWLDVDPAVNSNIAHFLSLISDIPPELALFLEQCLKNDKLLSPYYPSELSTLYYLAQAYSGDETLFLKKLTSVTSGLDLSALEESLAVSALLRIDPAVNVNRRVDKILRSQNTDGSWPASGYCIDKRTHKDTYYNGSKSLTTALALEALAIYRDRVPISQSHKDTANSEQDTMLQQAMSRIEQLDPLTGSGVAKSLQRLVASSNGKEILYLATDYNRSLIKPLPASKQPFFDNVTIATLYGWVAYTIYDDFLDDEGRPSELPVANIAHRMSFEGFLRALPKDKLFQNHVRETFNLIDTANAWEIQNCRFDTSQDTITITSLPDYENLDYLAYRSIGHTLGPLAVLVKSGYATNTNTFKDIRTALKHYIIAKQLNDDAHDWQEDFQNGHVSYVVSSILRELCVPYGVHKKADLLRVMQRHFWHHTLLTICADMHRHIILGREALERAACMKPNNAVSTLLDKTEVSIQDTRKKQQDTLDFMKYFK